MEKSRLLSLVMLLCSLFLIPPVGAQDKDSGKRVTLELNGESLSSALKKLEGLSGYKILFSYDDVNPYQVSGRVKDATVETALRMILKDKPFEYVIDGRFINVNLLKTGSKKPVGGGKKLSGVVISEEDGYPVIGASVRVIGSDIGAATDVDGRFTLSNVPAGAHLQISYIGMKTQTLPAEPGMEVILQSDSKTLGDVVVTGIFRKARESYTGSATVIGQEKLKMYKGQNLLQTLRNADASLNIPMNNALGSDPNALPQMNIRGTSSLPLSIDELNESTSTNVNTPLIIMDGFEISLTKLMDYNDEEIESITILKDASATAIYGSRGANGVIVVETKRPEPGKLKMTATAGISFEVPDLTSYDLLNARDKLELERMVGLYDSPGRPTTTMEYQQLYKERLRDVLSGVETDWMSKPLRTGVGQNYSVRLEGGRDEFRWGTSLSYKDTSGAMKGSSRRVFNGDITLMYTYKNLLFRNYTNISNTLSDESPYGSFQNYVDQQPYNKPYDEDGNLIRYYKTTAGSSYQSQNPLYDATLNTFDKSRSLGIINNFSIEWSILPELILRGQLGISTTRDTDDQFYPAEHSMFNSTAYSGVEGSTRKGRYTYGTGDSFSYDGRLTLSYTKTFKDKHQLYAGFDYSVSESKTRNYTFVAEGFSNEDLSFITNALQYEKGATPTGSEIVDRRIGFTGNVNYTYDNRYFIDGSYRIDGSSQFGSDKRFAPFWSVGVGWNIHHEKFMENVLPTISNLRLKASYGITGAMDFNQAAVETMYNYPAGDRYLNWSAAHLQGLGNSNLTWQETRETNVGIEFSLFDYRITGSFDYYIKDTEGLVSQMDLPLAMGFSSYYANVGKVRNRGFEASLSAYIIRDMERDFTWMVSGQLVYNKNKIVKLSDVIMQQNDEFLSSEGTVSNTSPAYLLYEGRPQRGIYVVRSLGIDPATGKEIYLDRNGNPTTVWDTRDRVYAGVDATYGSPYRGNASTMIRWKDITLNISFGYQWGGQTYNSTLINRVELTNNEIGRKNVDKRVYEDRWQKPGDKTFFKGYGNDATYATSRFVMDDNWFDIQSVSLQYRWSTAKLKQATGLQSILFGVNMSDLWHFSSIKYERGTSYPFARNIQGSVTFLF